MSLRLQTFVLLTRIFISGLAYTRSDAIPPEAWTTLNLTVGGRLQKSLPLAAPCFPIVNDRPSQVNSSACEAVQAGYTTPSFLSQRYEAFMFPQWSSCMATSKQCLLDDSSPTDPRAWTNFNCSQGSVSSYHIEVQTDEDVISAFAFARTTGVLLSIKNSGHDFKGRSSMQGSLALWTRNLQNISYDPGFIPIGGNESSPAITAGAGVNWRSIYVFADANNITAVGGYHETVGATGGWLMGGGHSVLSPVFGLGIDRVLQFRVVTPDGVPRIANAFSNPDLFWALRGGGGSTFGVVIEATFRVEPTPIKLQVASVSYQATPSNVLPYLSLIVENSLKWGQEGWGGHVFANNFINVNPLLSLSEAQDSLKNVTDFIRSQNGTVVIEELPNWFAFFEKYVLQAEESVGSAQILGSRLIPAQNFQTTVGRNQVLNTLVQLFPTIHFGILLTTPFLFNYTQGTTSATPAWRTALWHFAVLNQWSFNTTETGKQDAFGVVHNFTQLMRDLAPGSGAYFNEGDVFEPNFEDTFWGPNFPQLLAIKQKYDPFQLLDCWQCVGWSGEQDPRFSCYPNLQ